MPRHTDARFGAGHGLDLFGNTVGGGGVAFPRRAWRSIPCASSWIPPTESAPFGHGQDGEILARLGAALHRLRHLLDVIGVLWDQDDVRAARDTGVQRQPACLVAMISMPHDAAVAAGRGVDAVNDVRWRYHRRMEAERDRRCHRCRCRWSWAAPMILRPSWLSRLAVLWVPLPPRQSRQSSLASL